MSRAPAGGRRAAWRQRVRHPGWRSVGTLAITETVSFGVLSFAFSVLLLPMEEDLGATRGQLSAAFGASVAVRALVAPAVGAWIDRRGAHQLMWMGSIGAVATVLGWSFATSLGQLTLAFILLGVVGAAVLYEPAFALVSRWFDGHDRTTAVLAITTMAGFASTVFLPLTAMMVESFGWREALRWLAAILALTTVLPHLLLLEDPAQQRRGATQPLRWRPPDGLSLQEALRDRKLHLLTAGFMAGTIPVMAIGAHLPAMLIERGEPATLAATFAGGIGIAKAGGRFILGLAHRRLSFPLLLLAVFLAQAIALLLLASSSERWAALLFIALFGWGAGAVTIAKPLVIASAYGRRSFASIAGVVAVAVTLSQAVAPAIAGLGHDLTGTYGPVLVLLAATALFGAGCMALLSYRTRPRVTTT